MRLDLYKNVNTEEILAAIGLEESKIPRLRGVGIEDGKILIHTRTGGGNREQYDTVENYIDGEYGLNNNIKNYEDITDEYIKEIPESERLEQITEWKERREEVLRTKAFTNEYMTSNQYFISDADEEFDCTYANFWFRIPEDLKEKLTKMEDKEAKAVLGDSKTAIGLLFGDKQAVETVEKRLEELKTNS